MSAATTSRATASRLGTADACLELLQKVAGRCWGQAGCLKAYAVPFAHMGTHIILSGLTSNLMGNLHPSKLQPNAVHPSLGSIRTLIFQSPIQAHILKLTLPEH